MAYRIIDTRIWNDEKFANSSLSCQHLFLFILTHPEMTAVGAMRTTMAGLEEELDWEEKAFPQPFREAFREGLDKGFWKFDKKAKCLWLPKFVKYNRPASPNVVKAWAKCSDKIPECGLKLLAYQKVKDFAEGLGEAYAKAFREAFKEGWGHPSRIQEQEQEQEQEQDGGGGGSSEPKPPAREAAPPPPPPHDAEQIDPEPDDPVPIGYAMRRLTNHGMHFSRIGDKADRERMAGWQERGVTTAKFEDALKQADEARRHSKSPGELYPRHLEPFLFADDPKHAKPQSLDDKAEAQAKRLQARMDKHQHQEASV